MFGHQIKDIEDKTIEASKSANVEQSIHEHVQFAAIKMDAKDDGCLVAVAHDEAKDSVLAHELSESACVAESQTKPSCDALTAASASISSMPSILPLSSDAKKPALSTCKGAVASKASSALTTSGA